MGQSVGLQIVETMAIELQAKGFAFRNSAIKDSWDAQLNRPIILQVFSQWNIVRWQDSFKCPTWTYL